MRYRNRFIAALALAISFAACAHRWVPSGRPVPYEGYYVTLPTGMRLVVFERPEVVRVVLSVSYRVGSADDPAGKEGLAHLAEHLAFRGRPGGPGSPRLWDRLQSSGMVFQAVTTADHTDFWELGKGEQLDEMMNVEAARMSNPIAGLNENEFLAERDVVIAELHERFESYDGQAQLEWLLRQGFGDHAYGRPVGGTPESLRRITLADVRAWYREHYTPAHAVVVLSSAFPARAAAQTVANHFGTLASGDGGVREAPVVHVPPSIPKAPPSDAPMAVHRAPIERPELWVGWLLPGDYERSMGRTYAAEMALQVRLSRQFSRDDKNREQVDDYSVGLREMDGATLLYARLFLRREEDAEDVFGRVKKAQWRRRGDLWYQPELRAQILVRSYLQAEQLYGPAAAQFLRSTGLPDYVGGWQKLVTAHLSTFNTDYLDEFLTSERAFAVLVKPDRNLTARSMGAVPAPATDGQVDAMGDFVEDPEGAPFSGAKDLVSIAGSPGLDRVERRTLENGLQVVVARRGTLPIAEMRLVFRTQAEGAPGIPPGLPYLTIGSLCGTSTASELVRAGASRSLDRDLEHFTMIERGSSGNLPLLIETLGRWARLSHTCGDLSDDRRRYSRGLDRRAHRPSVRAHRLLAARLFPDHPYGRSATPESLVDLTSKDRDRWFDEELRPQRATLLLVSDEPITPGLWESIESEFGGWSSKLGAANDMLEPPALPAGGSVTLLDRPGATQALISVGLRRIPQGGGDEVATEAARWALETRLTSRLRLEQGVTYSVGAFDVDHRTASALVVSTAVEQAACAQSLAAILAAARQMAEKPVPAPLAARARVHLARSFGRGFDTIHQVASGLQQIAVRGLPPDHWERFPASIASLTPERIQAAARRLSLGNEVVVIIGDQTALAGQLRRAGFAVEVLHEANPEPEKP